MCVPPSRFDRRVKLFLRFGSDAHCARRPDHHAIAHFLEFCRREYRRAAEFRHVREQRRFDLAGESAEHFRVDQRFGKNRIGAGFEIELRARDRAFQSFGCRSISARDDVEVAARLDDGSDLGGHIARIGQSLVVQMAAFFRQQLVFDMHRRGAGILEFANETHGIQRFAVSGIAIHQHRQLAEARATWRTKKHTSSIVMIPRSGKTHGPGHRAAADINRVETGAFGEQARHPGMGAGNLQDLRPREQCTKTFSRAAFRGKSEPTRKVMCPPFHIPLGGRLGLNWLELIASWGFGSSNRSKRLRPIRWILISRANVRGVATTC